MRVLRSLTLLLFTFAAAAQNIDPKAVDRLMASTLKAWNLPGAAVVIVQNDRVVYAQGYGVKELGKPEPVTADTLFQLASTSKAFTSTALAMLASDGKLSFDDPVRKHLDAFRLADSCADAAVTLRDIVSHRTGLSRHDELWDDTTLTREEVIRAMAHVELSRPFRSAYQYQNILFIAAGEAVAQTAGMPWEEFVRTRIFTPLRMTHTITSDSEWTRADHATGHRYDWKSGAVTPRAAADTTTIGPAGAIKSSARDMGNWVLFHLSEGVFEGKPLVAAAQLAETKTPQTVMRMEGSSLELQPETNLMAYGMGWNIQDYRGEQLVSHGGALNGFRTRVSLLPKRKAGFVVMINAERGYSLLAVQNALADLLLGKPSRDWNAYYLPVDRRIDEKDEQDRLARLAQRVPDTTPSRPLADYAGPYSNEAYGTATISLVNDTLNLQWNRRTAPLTHFHYDVFRTESKDNEFDETVSFTLDERKKVKSLTLFGETFVRK
ncbi:MAG: serine hydrolase [Acidobacteriota bacterium]